MRTLELGASALLVIDMQRYFVELGAPSYLAEASALVPRVVALIEAFRGVGRPVLFTRHAHRRGSQTGQMGRWWDGKLPWDGDGHAELIGAIAPRRNEVVLTKGRYSAFEGTGLATALSVRGISTLVLCGVMTNLCVETTARHAFLKDLQPVVVEDACAANTPAHHHASILNLSYGFAIIVSTDEIVERLGEITPSKEA
jgi:ureidoacrylate peracid hydrolase